MTDQLKTRGLLDIESLDRSTIQELLDRAKFFQPGPGETYKRLESLKAILTVESPVAFRRRLLFVGKDALDRPRR